MMVKNRIYFDNLYLHAEDSTLIVSGTVSASDPINDSHLTTKAYVDNHDWSEADIVDIDKYTQAEVDTIASGIEAQIITDHGALTGLSDDDHPQYVLVDGSRGFTNTVSGVDPTQDYHLTTKLYVDTEVAAASGTTTFIGLTDTPNSYNTGWYLRSTASGLEWATASDGEEASGKTGVETIASGVDSVGVTFGSPFNDTNYSIVISLMNTIDANPAQYGGTINSKTVNGFTVLLSDFMNTGNYELNWAAWEEAGGGGNYDNYSSWSFAVDGVAKDAITSSGILNFVGGGNVTITRSAEDEITISGTAGGGGAATLLELTDTPAGYDDGKYLKSTAGGTEWGVVAAASTIVSVGSSGADYDNFDDAIDYLRTLNGGKIVVITDMTITSTDEKDVSNIIFEGDLYGGAGQRKINKSADGGFWYGYNVMFKDVSLWRQSDHTQNEIFKFTEDFQYVTLQGVVCFGLTTGMPQFDSGPCFNCNGKEAHLIGRGTNLIGAEEATYVAFSNPATLVLHLYDQTGIYLANEHIDALFMTSSCVLQGNPTYNTPGNPTLIEKASGTENDSTVAGTTIKDALENLNEKNGIGGTFTTTDGKTITVVDGQITSIV